MGNYCELTGDEKIHKYGEKDIKNEEEQSPIITHPVEKTKNGETNQLSESRKEEVQSRKEEVKSGKEEVKSGKEEVKSTSSKGDFNNMRKMFENRGMMMGAPQRNRRKIR